MARLVRASIRPHDSSCRAVIAALVFDDLLACLLVLYPYLPWYYNLLFEWPFVISMPWSPFRRCLVVISCVD